MDNNSGSDLHDDILKRRSWSADLRGFSPGSSPRRCDPDCDPDDDRNRDRDGAEGTFEAFAETIRQDLAPRGLLEQVLADRVILSAWRLREVAGTERAAIPYRAQSPSPSCLPRSVFFVARTLETTLDLLRRLRKDDSLRRGRSAATDEESASASDFDLDLEPDCEAPSDFSNEWAVVPVDRCVANDPEAISPTGEAEETLPARWQDRLIFDVNVSEDSPVVKGTWVTVNHVVSLIVDGWTWTDILRTHPELTADDIRTCLAYTVAQDGGED